MKEEGNNELRVIDLFCGVGGLSLGAARAGFTVVAAIDSDPRAIEAHVVNFPRCKQIKADITGLSGVDLLSQSGLGDKVIHGVIGGPPCQGFSRIGRRSPDDPRNILFDHFFRLVAELRPWFYVAENVLGVLDAQFDVVRQTALARLSGYRTLGPLTLKASDFGVATSRERLFFIGFRPEYVNQLQEAEFEPHGGVVKVDVQTALRGLPKKISPDWQSEVEGWRPLTCRPEGPFWEKVFNDVPEGVGNPEAIRRLTEDNVVSGCLGTRHTHDVTERFAALDEGAVDGPSRAVRLERKAFCPTLRSGTGPDRGSFQALRPIHPTEPRVITPREAARLQGFPDWFRFDPTKWHSFRHIGNSVSPILAENIMRVITAHLHTEGNRNGK